MKKRTKLNKRTIRSRRRARALRLLLAALLCLALCACDVPGGGNGPSNTPRPTGPAATPAPTAAPSPQPSAEATPEPTEEPIRVAPEEALTIACEPFSGRYDPFDAAEGSDRLLLRLTQTPLLCRNADGSFAETAEGVGAAGLRVMSRGEGSTLLRITMRENVRYDDGGYADASDLIFTLYVLLDPDYDGNLDLRDSAIAGLEAYRTGTSPAVLEKCEELYGEAAAGEGPLAELMELCLREAWGRSLRTLTRRCREEYLESYAYYALGVTAEAALEQEGALRAFTMWCAGLAESADDYGIMKDSLGNKWNPAAGNLPEEGDLIDLFSASYGSAAAFDDALGMETQRLAKEEFIRRCGEADPENIPAIQVSGITKVDDYTVDLLLESFSQEDLERLGQLWLLPLSAYGEESLFRPAEGCYGFPYRDLSALRAGDRDAAVGAGPFRMAESEEGFHLEANLYYYGGSPKVGEIWFETAPREELLQLVSEGSADLACLPGSPELFAAARELPDLALRSISTDVWGILTLNRRSKDGADDTGDSGEDAAGEEETETEADAERLARAGLEEALLELATVCCRASAGEYFGGAALPVTDEETEEEALEAFRRAMERLPEGETVSFTALVPGGGKGDHPCWAGLSHAGELLKELGAELIVQDFTDDADFWAAVDAGEGDLWAGAEHLGAKAEEALGEDRRAVYRRLDLLALNSQRFELLSLPVELTWARDHISVIETLELK